MEMYSCQFVFRSQHLIIVVIGCVNCSIYCTCFVLDAPEQFVPPHSSISGNSKGLTFFTERTEEGIPILFVEIYRKKRKGEKEENG